MSLNGWISTWGLRESSIETPANEMANAMGRAQQDEQDN